MKGLESDMKGLESELRAILDSRRSPSICFSIFILHLIGCLVEDSLDLLLRHSRGAVVLRGLPAIVRDGKRREVPVGEEDAVPPAPAAAC